MEKPTIFNSLIIYTRTFYNCSFRVWISRSQMQEIFQCVIPKNTKIIQSKNMLFKMLWIVDIFRYLCRWACHVHVVFSSLWPSEEVCLCGWPETESTDFVGPQLDLQPWVVNFTCCKDTVSSLLWWQWTCFPHWRKYLS